MGRAIPEVLVMSGAVKIFTLNTALWDMSSGREKEERCEVFVLSIFPFPQSFPSLLLSLASDKVGQHYTSVQHTGGEQGEDLSCERDGGG